ncbi:MAG: enoyl-CoA hydratase [Hyphomicrobiales bacterium]|nr:enoyl-CoA hydratase [Hyphomicrobiales bacterium]
MSDAVLSEIRGKVGLITFNRPQALNAVNLEVMNQLITQVEQFDSDENIGCIVLCGNEKAFVAGADIKEMQDKSYMDMFIADKQSEWQKFAATRTPMIAAVSGYALGGGCEIAMMCDMIFASDTAKFGQPEIKLGVIPGWGGTQRLTRAVGKSKAMDMILTGRMMSADEAERSGLVSRVIPVENLLDETIKVASQIADYSSPSAMLAKEAVNRAFEASLAEGIQYERRVFYSLFATEDQKEGMEAFAAKRQAEFKNR